MNLKHLTDQVLLEDIKIIAGNERKATVELLYHLKEVDRRKLYSEMKYSSLFEYCVKELGYSEASAQRRITSARLLKNIPQLSRKIEEGVLTLSNISQASQFFKEKNLGPVKTNRSFETTGKFVIQRVCKGSSRAERT